MVFGYSGYENKKGKMCIPLTLYLSNSLNVSIMSNIEFFTTFIEKTSILVSYNLIYMSF